jgi:hypothetical protein
MGISGDQFYGFDQGGPDSRLVSAEWVRENIQIGPLGEAYPDFAFIPEGYTPTFLYLVQNGLGSPENPEWGSWGGRYLPVDSSPESPYHHYYDATDRVVGENGQVFRSNHATIWRWRKAFQNEFAARMQWTLHGDVARANHSPVIVVNGSTGPEPLFLRAAGGDYVDLDASGTYDPDGDSLVFKWFHYKEVTATQWIIDNEVKDVEFEDLDADLPGRHVRAKVPEKCTVDPSAGLSSPQGQVMHLILEVCDNGSPSLTTYKRIVVQSLIENEG